MSNVEKEPGPQGDSPGISTENVDQEKKHPREYKDFGHENQQATSQFSLIIYMYVPNSPQRGSCGYGYRRVASHFSHFACMHSHNPRSN